MRINDSNWTYRGYLPHFDDQKTTQTLTFRLKNSYPKVFIKECREVLKKAKKGDKRYQRLREKADRVLDRGHGVCYLKVPEVAKVVQEAMLRNHKIRYFLHGWVVMPNHVHVMITQMNGWSIEKIVNGWRTHSALACNQLLQRTGSMWSRGVYDRYVRSRDHFNYFMTYIELNPVKAKLCRAPRDWPWSSASHHLDDEGEWKKGVDLSDNRVGENPKFRKYCRR